MRNGCWSAAHFLLQIVLSVPTNLLKMAPHRGPEAGAPLWCQPFIGTQRLEHLTGQPLVGAQGLEHPLVHLVASFSGDSRTDRADN